MDTDHVDPIANALLYEGYLLYPYRAAVKNVQRWSFGSVYPRSVSEKHGGGFPSRVRSRCLAVGDEQATLAIQARFLHLNERTSSPSAAAGAWQECIERRIDLAPRTLRECVSAPRRQAFSFPAHQFADEGSGTVRRQEPIEGAVEVSLRPDRGGSYLVGVQIENHSQVAPEATESTRARVDGALLWTLASAHVVLQLRGAEFVSRIDPPAEFRDVVVNDPDDRLWPVLVGQPPQRDTMLCSPIILYDYPEIAAASAGNFYDATEIDEMLTLRVLTLSEAEVQEVELFDPRGRELLERTRNMAQNQLANLHGGMRRVEG